MANSKTTTTRKTRAQLNAERKQYASEFDNAIDESIASEFKQSAAIIESLDNQELSSDDIAELERNAQAKVLRAERTAHYKNVSAEDVEKLKALGIQPSVIGKLANDSKAGRHVEHVFRALANSDKTLLKGNQNVMNYMVALTLADDYSDIKISYLHHKIDDIGSNEDKRNNGERHAKLFSSVYERLGMLEKNFDGKRLDSVTINEKSKVWKRYCKMFDIA